MGMRQQWRDDDQKAYVFEAALSPGFPNPNEARESWITLAVVGAKEPRKFCCDFQ